MDRVYGFLLCVLLLGVALVANLLTYMRLGDDFFYLGMFVLIVFFIVAVFSYTTILGQLFSLIVFSITLLTGVILFQTLFTESKEILALLLIVGSFWFVFSLAGDKYSDNSDKKSAKKKRRDTPLPLPLSDGELADLRPAKRGEFLELHEVDKLVQKKTRRRQKKKV